MGWNIRDEKKGKKVSHFNVENNKSRRKNLLSEHNDEGNEKGRETWIINHGLNGWVWAKNLWNCLFVCFWILQEWDHGSSK